LIGALILNLTLFKFMKMVTGKKKKKEQFTLLLLLMTY